MDKMFNILCAMNDYERLVRELRQPAVQPARPANDGDVICAGCGYAIPDDELAARYGADVDVYPADALCAGCAVDEQDSPDDCPTDAMWK